MNNTTFLLWYIPLNTLTVEITPYPFVIKGNMVPFYSKSHVLILRTSYTNCTGMIDWAGPLKHVPRTTFYVSDVKIERKGRTRTPTRDLPLKARTANQPCLNASCGFLHRKICKNTQQHSCIWEHYWKNYSFYWKKVDNFQMHNFWNYDFLKTQKNSEIWTKFYSLYILKKNWTSFKTWIISEQLLEHDFSKNLWVFYF